MAAAAIARRRGWMALVTTSNQVRKFSELAKSSVNGKRAFLVDTLGLARRLEAQGVPPNQAEAITSAITKAINDSLENVLHSVVTNGWKQMSEMVQEANLSKFKSELQRLQEHHFSLLRRETEKLKVDIEKMRSELRCEIDQVTAGLCLDLNIERGRLCEEISKQSSVPSNLTNKLDREILSFKVQLAADKYDAIKHCVGFLISISAVGVVALKIFM